MRIKKVSIIVPVYNELSTIDTIYRRLSSLKLHTLKEVLFVDDGSTDGSREYLLEKQKKANKSCVFIFHKKNQGKGEAIKSAIEKVTGEYVIIQDADLEYDPSEIQNLIKLAEKENALIVFGSRNKDIKNHHIYSHYYYGVKVLTWFINKLYNQNLTDPETCYKLISSDLLRFIGIEESGFGIEIEITAKISRLGIKIHETSISYTPRSFSEGKKIKTKDGIWAFFLTLKYKLFDLHYGPIDKVIRDFRTKASLSALKLRKSDYLLDVGCGRQGYLGWELRHKLSGYVGVDFEVPSVEVDKLRFIKADVNKMDTIEKSNYFDKALGLAIFEHLTSPKAFLDKVYSLLKKDGLIVLTTPAPSSDPILRVISFLHIIDPEEITDHKAYYTKEGLELMIKEAGFRKVEVKSFLFGLNTLVIAKK